MAKAVNEPRAGRRGTASSPTNAYVDAIAALFEQQGLTRSGSRIFRYPTTPEGIRRRLSARGSWYGAVMLDVVLSHPATDVFAVEFWAERLALGRDGSKASWWKEQGAKSIARARRHGVFGAELLHFDRRNHPRQKQLHMLSTNNPLSDDLGYLAYVLQDGLLPALNLTATRKGLLGCLEADDWPWRWYLFNPAFRIAAIGFLRQSLGMPILRSADEFSERVGRWQASGLMIELPRFCDELLQRLAAGGSDQGGNSLQSINSSRRP